MSKRTTKHYEFCLKVLKQCYLESCGSELQVENFISDNENSLQESDESIKFIVW